MIEEFVMKRYRVVAVLSAGLFGLGAAGACSADPPAPDVPQLAAGGSAETGGGKGTGGKGTGGKGTGGKGTGGGPDADDNPNAVGGDSSAGRRARLHAAAQCIREHGAPRYQDPLLTADGYVYTDDLALRGVEEQTMTAIDAACGDLIRAASFSMRDQGPPPPKLIQAGVRSAQCLRANGLSDVKDPTADRRFTPGKGFGLDPAELPTAGKQDPTVRRALQACRRILDEEAATSSLGNLGNA